MASLTITLSDDVLKVLKTEKSIMIALDSSGTGRGRVPQATPARSRVARAAPATKGKTGPYRPGSLPAKLLGWAGGRKRAFGVPDLMKKFKIKRGHASMLITYVTKGGAVKRVGRGAYAAA